MFTFIYRMSCCFILFFGSTSFAKMVTISGTVTDTILETGGGKEPVLKVVPVEACSISVSAGCTETVLDKYFVKTDKSGYYSLTVNLPDECTYKIYLFRFEGKSGTKKTVPVYLGIAVDSMVSSLKENLYIPHQIPADSLKTTQYTHYFGLRTNTSIHGGDTITVSHALYGLSDNADTLRFNKCKHNILLLTTSKDTVYNSDFNCSDSGSWLHLKKGWSTSYLLKVPVPIDLHKTNASFAQDRKLILELKLYDHDISFITLPFNVIDTDVKTINLITASSSKQSVVSTSKSVLSVKSNQLHLFLNQPGTYSITLFTIDGKSIGKIVKDHYFSAGEHTFTLGNLNRTSSQLHIATLNGNGISASTLINNFDPYFY